jgi:nicotinate-nucleotide pyrophosphorylase (carboxylating)
MKLINSKELNRIIKYALREDIGPKDLTTVSVISKSQNAIAYVIAKENGIICGLKVAKKIFQHCDPKIKWKAFIKDGNEVEAGDKIVKMKGNLRTLLICERTALNFLQRMSGISTITKKYVDEISLTKTKLLDTRKTAPGLRMLDKYAVKIGGGTNHRFGLYDMVLIKDNHIKAAGSITKAVQQVRKKNKKKFVVEVEVDSIGELKEALSNDVDIIMLDNMDVDEMKHAVQLIDGKVKTEASGKITLENIRKVAETGVDFISVGALTHSVKALDISMEIE